MIESLLTLQWQNATHGISRILDLFSLGAQIHQNFRTLRLSLERNALRILQPTSTVLEQRRAR